jgi:hypothetical protein
MKFCNEKYEITRSPEGVLQATTTDPDNLFVGGELIGAMYDRIITLEAKLNGLPEQKAEQP